MPGRERRACPPALLCALCLLLLAPSAAHAGTVTRIAQPGFEGSTPVTDVIYVYRAGLREENRVRVGQVQSGGTGLSFGDSAAAVSPGTPDCTANGTNEVRCLAPASLAGRRRGRVTMLVETLDRADRLRVGAGVAGAADLGSGNDRALGADGGLTAYGRSGRDVLRSGAGADLLDGGGGRDLVDAGAGNDTLRGQSGNDRLFGGAGGDRIDDGSGFDRVFGDSGADRISPRGNRRRVQEVSCGRGRDVVLGPDRFVNVGRDCELTETARGDRLFARPLRIQDGALVFLAGCTKQGCRGTGGAAVSVRLGADPPRHGRRLGVRRYRVGLLGSREVHVRLSRGELRLLTPRGGTALEIRAAGMAYRILIRVR